jgi:hypothetical protein
MWIPRSTEELEAAVVSGDLDETSQLDFKEALPAKKDNAEIAVDVSAMSVDGGVLVYGVGEGEDKRPTLLRPIDLAGAAERIDQVLRTSVHEPPSVRFESFPASGEPGLGYLVVVVPPSPRAPHQVVARGRYQHRYYGRGPTGNRILTEADIARLYARREQWRFNASEHLQKVISRAPFGPDPDLGFLHAFVRPVVVDDGRWTRAARDDPAGLQQRMLAAAQRANHGLRYDPALADVSTWVRHGADAWRLGHRVSTDAYRSVQCDLDFDGSGHFFCGRAAARQQPNAWQPGEPGALVLFEQIVAGNLSSFFALMGELYAADGYVGPVDLGIALTGIENARSLFAVQNLFDNSGYPVDAYTTTARVDAHALNEPRPFVQETLSRFFDALIGPGYDPFR